MPVCGVGPRIRDLNIGYLAHCRAVLACLPDDACLRIADRPAAFLRDAISIWPDLHDTGIGASGKDNGSQNDGSHGGMLC